MNLKSDYYYGSEGNQYVFYRIPKILFTEERFKKMSNDARVLYGLMLDRMGLSIRNNWRDNNDRIYIYFTLGDIQKYMNCGHTKGTKIIGELENINLIERVRQEQGKPIKIYIKKFFEDNDNFYETKNIDASHKDLSEKEAGNPVGQNYEISEMKNQDCQKTEVLTAENEQSRLPKNGSLDCRFSASNNNKSNNNEFNKSKSMSCLMNDYDFERANSFREYPLNLFVDFNEKQKYLEYCIKNR